MTSILVSLVKETHNCGYLGRTACICQQTSQKAHLTIFSILLHLTRIPTNSYLSKGKIVHFYSLFPTATPEQQLRSLLPALLELLINIYVCSSLLWRTDVLDFSGLVQIFSIKGYSTTYHFHRQLKVIFHLSSLWTIINETCIFSVTVLLTTTSETARMTVHAKLYPTVLLLSLVKLGTSTEHHEVLGIHFE